jgi:glutathione peroxidase
MVERRALMLGGLALATPALASTPNAFDFTFQALEGGPMPLAQYRGRVLLVVNTASFCGFTPQYAALQRLHDAHEARGLTVVGVPSNDFNQESTDARKIREFCEGMFGITFPMTALNHVRGERARIPSSPGRRARPGQCAGTSTNTWSAGTGGGCRASPPRRRRTRPR